MLDWRLITAQPPRFAFENASSQLGDPVISEADLPENTGSDTKLNLTKRLVNVSPWMLEGAGSCYTITSLESIRRIRVSRGKEGLSHNFEDITGLWIEYENPLCNTIVGQWFEEIGCVELDHGERLVEILIWNSTEMGHGPPFQNLIRIKKIQFTTSKRTHEIQRPTDMETKCLRYRENPFELLVSPCRLISQTKHDR